MGNTLAQPVKGVTTGGAELSEVPGAVYQSALGVGRLFRTCTAVIEEDEASAQKQRRAVIKVHLKRPGAPSLAQHVRMVELLCGALEGTQHTLPYMRAVDAEHSASLIRPHIWRSLTQRLGVRPFLSTSEKHWIAFQLLHALAEAHGRGMMHGDIKGENVLLTSFGWLYISDFAWFKPIQLPADNPADFSFYFDTRGGRRCAVAPERFVQDVAPDAKLTPAMDIFSAGCVLAEMLLDGRPLFDLSALLAYKRGEYSPCEALREVDDDALAALVLNMVVLDPAERASAAACLEQGRGDIFPDYFDDLHEFCCNIIPLDADERIRAVDFRFDFLHDILSRPSRGKSSLTTHRMHDNTKVDISCDAMDNDSSSSPTALAFAPHIKSQSMDDSGMISSKVLGGSTIDMLDSMTLNTHTIAPLSLSDSGELAAFDVADLAANVNSPRVLNEAASVAEVVTEALYEHEMRESEAEAFTTAKFEALWAARALEGVSSRRKEEVTLPVEGGWEWDGDWTISNQKPQSSNSESNSNGGVTQTNADGWSYRVVKKGEGEESQNHVWSSKPVAESLWRRRRWTRRRIRRSSSARQNAANKGAKSLLSTTESGQRTFVGRGNSMEHMYTTSSSSVAAATKHPPCPAGMGLLAVIVCSSSRGASLGASKRLACRLLDRCALYCDDSVRLQRIVPYLVALTSEGCASVKTMALRCLARVLTQIFAFPPSDVRVFQDYIFPSLSNLPAHPEETVRVEYAAAIAPIAMAAHGFIDRARYFLSRKGSQADGNTNANTNADEEEDPMLHSSNNTNDNNTIKNNKELDVNENNSTRELNLQRKETDLLSWEAHRTRTEMKMPGSSEVDSSSTTTTTSSLSKSFGELRKVVLRVLMEVMQGAQTAQRLAVLAHAGTLCKVFGRRESTDVLLPLFITCLNNRDWQLRAKFMEAIPTIIEHVGSASLEAFCVPCIEQALADPEMAVTNAALGCIRQLLPQGVLRRRVIKSLVSRVSPLLCHPSSSIRESTVALLAAVSNTMRAAEVYVTILPLIRSYLKRGVDEEQLVMEMGSHSSSSSSSLLLEALIPQISPDVYALALSIAQKKLSDAVNVEKLVALEATLSKLSGNSEELRTALSGMESYILTAATASNNYHGHRSSSQYDDMSLSNNNSNNAMAMRRRRSSTRPQITTAPVYMVMHDENGKPRRDEKGILFATRCPPVTVVVQPRWGGSAVPVVLQKSLSDVDLGLSDRRDSMHNYRLSVSSRERGSTNNRERRGIFRSRGSDSEFGQRSQNTQSHTSQSSSSSSASQGVYDAMPPSQKATTGVAMDWSPRGVLTAHLAEHVSSISTLIVASSGAFVVSGSEDGTCKIWDVRRLEKDVAFSSRATYKGHRNSKVTCAATLPGTNELVASGSSLGSVHLWNVEYSVAVRRGVSVPDKYAGTNFATKISPEEGSILAMHALDSFALVYATQRGGVHAHDTRSGKDAWRLPFVPQGGMLNHLAVDPTPSCLWIVTASNRGIISLWDMRYQMPLSTWSMHSARGGGIDAIAAACPLGHTRDEQMSSPPMLYLTTGGAECCLVDARDGRPSEVLRVITPDDPPGTAASCPRILSSSKGRKSEPNGMVMDVARGFKNALKATVDHLITDQKDAYCTKGVLNPPAAATGGSVGVRSILPLRHGLVLSAGDDKIIRLWNSSNPENSCRVSAPSGRDPTSARYVAHDHSGVRVVQELPVSHGEHPPSPPNPFSVAHQDVVQSMCLTPASHRFLMTGSRDGIIKVWR